MESKLGKNLKITFQELPTEVHCLILSQLDWKSLFFIQRVSSWIRKLVQTTVQLQYMISLGVAGKVDNPSFPRLTTSERLNVLRESDENRLKMSWKPRASFEKNGLPELFGSLLCETGGAGLRFTELPTPFNTSPPRSWMIDLQEVDVVADVEQDLLLVVRYHLVESGYQIWGYHVQLSTGDAHLDARHKYVTYMLEGESRPSPLMRVCGPVCVIFTHEIIAVWNWKGDAVPMFFTDAISFEFLSERYLLVLKYADHGGHYNEQIHFLSVLDLQPVLTNSIPPDDTETFKIKVEFGLPPLHREYELVSAYLDSDGVTPPGSCGSNTSSDRPFTDSPDEMIYILVLNGLKKLTMFIPRRTIMYWLHFHSSSSSSLVLCRLIDGKMVPIPPRVPWDTWGPSETRLLGMAYDVNWSYSLSGSRFVYWTRRTDQVDMDKVIFYDFNSSVTHFRKNQLADTSPEGGEAGASFRVENGTRTGDTEDPTYIPLVVDSEDDFTVVDSGQPSIVEAETYQIFAHDVTTSCPYIGISAKLQVPNILMVVLTPDGFVTIPHDSDDQERRPMYHVYTAI